MLSDHREIESQQGDDLARLSPAMIAAGLHAAANEIRSSQERESLIQLAEAIRTKSSFDEALSSIPGLPLELRNIVEAGVKTGRLPFLLEEYMTVNRQTRAMWRRFYLALAYPFIVILSSAAIMIAFMVYTVPQFKDIYEDFGVELPLLTISLIALADFFQVVWFPLLIAGVVLLALLLTRRVLPFAKFRSRLFHVVPVIGNAQRMAASAEFCSRLAVLVECNLPLDETLRIVSNSISDPYFGHVAKRIAIRVESGETGEDIADYGSGLPHLASNAFRWANDPKTFSDGLRSLAIVFGSQARITMSQLVLVTEPFAFISVGAFAGFVVISTMLPLIKLLNWLS